MTRLLIALAVLPLACLCWFARRRDEQLVRVTRRSGGGVRLVHIPRLEKLLTA